MQQRFEAEIVEVAFGEQVKARREAMRLSQRALSELLLERGIKLDPTAITRIERRTDQRGIRLSEATALASILGIDLQKFLTAFQSPETQVAFLTEQLAASIESTRDSALDAIEILTAITNLAGDQSEGWAELLAEALAKAVQFAPVQAHSAEELEAAQTLLAGVLSNVIVYEDVTHGSPEPAD